MPPRGRWECPEHYPQEKWTELLASSWSKNDSTKQLMGRINHKSQVNVEDEWTMFNQCLYDMFRSVHTQQPGAKTLPSREKGSSAKVVFGPQKSQHGQRKHAKSKKVEFHCESQHLH